MVNENVKDKVLNLSPASETGKNATKEVKPNTEEDFDEQTALHLTRSFWLAFNNINMYGELHPQAIRAVEAFHAQIKHQFIRVKRIVFHFEREGFYCGTWRVDRELKVSRLIERFTNSGIDSISIEPAVTSQGLGFLVVILIDTKNFHTASDIEGALKAAEAQGIRINHLKFSRVQILTEQQTTQEPNELEVEITSLPEIVTGPMPDKPLDKPLDNWPDLKNRLIAEIGAFKSAEGQSPARFDRLYDTLETLLLRYLFASPSTEGDGSGEIGEHFTRIEETDWQLMNELDGPLREHQLLESVGERLKDRFNSRVALLWADTMWQQFKPIEEDRLPDFFARVEADMAQIKEPQVFMQSLLYLLDERGLSDKIFALIWERLVRKNIVEDETAKGAINRLNLPKEIQNRKDIVRDLETEMYRYNRYASPFSCLSLSLFGVRDEPKSQIRTYTEDELLSLYQWYALELQLSLRKLDRIGSLGPMRQNHLLLLLPMTDVTGAVVLMERLESRSEGWKIHSQRGFFYPVMIFSSLTFNAEKIKDTKAMLRKIKNKHKKKTEFMSKNILGKKD